MSKKDRFPQKIVCLTEEPVEWLYLLGEEDRIAGVSCFVKRPEKAQSLPVTSAFTHANLKKIVSMKPDLVIGHSDIQKDIAKSLIEEGLNVFIANHRSLEETLDYLLFLGKMVNQAERASALIEKYRAKLKHYSNLSSAKNDFPKVYLEEWYEPMICGIRYFSEIFRAVGARDIFADVSDKGILGRDRIINWERVVDLKPDIMLGCWCGKELDRSMVKSRVGWTELGIKDDYLIELPPEIFLQPGPALFEEGIDLAYNIVNGWQKR